MTTSPTYMNLFPPLSSLRVILFDNINSFLAVYHALFVVCRICGSPYGNWNSAVRGNGENSIFFINFQIGTYHFSAFGKTCMKTP